MKKNILFIDENRAGAQFIIDGLSQVPEPFNPIFTQSAEQGIRVLKRQAVDIVFARYLMGGINGLLFVSAVKSYRKFWKQRIFLYDQHISEDDSKMANRLGASGCIECTTNVPTLSRQLKAILNPELLPSYVFFSSQSPDPISLMIDAYRPPNELTVPLD